jgi:hypothetical protein
VEDLDLALHEVVRRPERLRRRRCDLRTEARVEEHRSDCCPPHRLDELGVASLST